MRFIDLFAGIGGMRLSFERAGCKCVFSSEIDKYACETYNLNFGEYPSGDITQIDAKDIPNHNILIAGFPCQSFSTFGKRLGFCDTRGTLFFDIIRILEEKQPKSFLLENVKGLISHNNGKTLKIILKSLKDLNYNVVYEVLNTLNYGLPQNRERIFIVGMKHDFFEFPKKNKNDLMVKDILEENVDISYQPTKTLGRYKYFDGMKDLNHCKYSQTIQTKQDRKMNKGFIKINNWFRFLTERECLRLQGFPESFKMYGSRNQQYKQIGNSVSINVVEAIAKKMVKFLNGEIVGNNYLNW